MMEHSVGEETSTFEQEVIAFLEYCLGNTERILVFPENAFIFQGSIQNRDDDWTQSAGIGGLEDVLDGQVRWQYLPFGCELEVIVFSYSDASTISSPIDNYCLYSTSLSSVSDTRHMEITRRSATQSQETSVATVTMS